MRYAGLLPSGTEREREILPEEITITLVGVRRELVEEGARLLGFSQEMPEGHKALKQKMDRQPDAAGGLEGV